VIGALRKAWNNFRGSGDAAVTVPPMDGALRPNRLLEEAELLAKVEAPDDIADTGEGLVFSSGGRIVRLGADGRTETLEDCSGEITALAALPGKLVAAAVAGKGVLLLGTDGSRRSVETLGNGPARCITALTFASDRELLVAQGSASRPPTEWKRDLMERRSDGSVWRVGLEGGAPARLAGGLGWPFGVVAANGKIVVSESWKHRLVTVTEGGRVEPLLSDLPGYPARIHRHPAGGFWLAIFAPRNQIIEFIQREPAFLARMIEEVDEAYWAAPSLKPSATFLEPLQGGAQKHLGMLKPWAPTRSYGLVVKLDDAFRPISSFHSRADGTRHGVFTCIPHEGKVVAASRGGGVIVAIDPAAGAAHTGKVS
jgi:hypothetical protein